MRWSRWWSRGLNALMSIMTMIMVIMPKSMMVMMTVTVMVSPSSPAMIMRVRVTPPVAMGVTVTTTKPREIWVTHLIHSSSPSHVPSPGVEVARPRTTPDLS